MDCPNCNTELKYYNGCLGYEALRCYECGYELDLNAEANAKATQARLNDEDEHFHSWEVYT
jgi:DNA-directed RNA polymerase subunit M/transcription elongation factor TFIIS